ncbi:2-dehydropantoate 2-reductase [Halomonas sp. McH1-25]|uniref:ketopantoate reductase family protein n=1 Tax=unclassified Halomonas TaxID=2609666 RepID=UPI001EF5F9BD|nr:MULTISPECIES: 2-dehydropantoate 2-reductase [unclassified Halomonas]MCG7602241.1 2-dehydropantoate 2-reductase [Halomonas sp. McH1-25]MCP1344596.1 2-dehydropantoate 2-reductase [Halomonas sp. FL8]MCP1362870.1 2-dehydropantoate 2-reductase [Halomonas sp. BBD45]MCP1363746.1 2-dehydropantoate 2-reductase [Halomonas sp. BBD48]
MKIAIVGAGAMGGLFGVRLVLAGLNVVFIEAVNSTIQTIRKEGITLEASDINVNVKVPIGRALDFQGVFDLLMIFTKGVHTYSAINSVRHLVGPSTWVLSLQNGLGNAEIIANIINPGRVIVGMTDLPADLVKPGAVRSHGEGHVEIWTYNDTECPEVSVVANALRSSGIPCAVGPQAKISVWEKVAFNAALNAICAISHRDVGQVGNSKYGRELAIKVVNEAVSVAKSEGVDAREDRIVNAVQHAFDNQSQHNPSMLQDLKSGRITEIDFINGAIIERGSKNGIQTPINETLFSLVKLVEAGYMK